MENKAYNYCIYLLSKRDYPEVKLRAKLKEKGYSQETSNQVIEKLHELGYIREEAYIRSRVKALILKGYSPYYITQKLKGESLQITTDEVQELYEIADTNLTNQLESLIEKKLRSLRNVEDKQKKKEKLIRFLASKGHRINFESLDKYL